MGASAMGARMPRGEAGDDVTGADDGGAFVATAVGSRRNVRTRTRPLVDARAAMGTAASVAELTDGRRATGARLP